MADNYKPAACISISAAGEQKAVKIGPADQVIAAFKDLRAAGGKGAATAYVLTGRGIEYKAKFSTDPKPAKKRAKKASTKAED